MSKYKLIKEYPGSPKLGTIVNYYSNWGLYSINHHLTEIYTQSMVESYPEYWEKVVEKEYEILSIMDKDSNIYNLYREGCFGYPNYTYTLDYVLDKKLQKKRNAKISIHSVKRLSDGEVFTIGDKVAYFHRNTNIKLIYYNEHNQLSFKVEGYSSPLTGVFGTSKLEKVKNPILTTEDGVEIFDEEQTVYWLEIGKWRLYEKKSINMKNLLDNLHYSDRIKNFSTKEKAEEYVLYNKPMLSLNEVFKNIEFQYRKDLIKLAKEKIKL